MRMKFVSFLLSINVLFVSGCALIYQPDVQQGNYVTEDMMQNINIGMTKTEVEYYLGRPLLQDPFHNNRWDYFYSYRERRDSQREENNLTLWFDNDRLAKIEGEIESSANRATTPAAPELNKPVVNREDMAWYEKLFSPFGE